MSLSLDAHCYSLEKPQRTKCFTSWNLFTFCLFLNASILFLLMNQLMGSALSLERAAQLADNTQIWRSERERSKCRKQKLIRNVLLKMAGVFQNSFWISLLELARFALCFTWLHPLPVCVLEN